MTVCQIDIDPFYFGKIEHERGPILYVPDKIIEWSSSKPIFFEGVRGSGKSSALRLLSWDVAWKVSSVSISCSNIVKRFFQSPKHVGLYYRVEDIDTPLWNRWHVDKDTAQRYFGTYIEYIYIDLLLDALIGIRKKSKEVFSDREAERIITSNLLKNCFPSPNERPRLFNLSFSSLRDYISDIHIGIRNLVFQNASEEAIKSTFNVIGPGSLLRVFGETFIKVYPELNDWVILLLLDDANFLKAWQAEVINSMVASCKAPLSYKISSLVNLYPTLETLDENRPLVLDYIEKVPLPTHNAPFLPKPFRTNLGMKYLTFINNVCKARLEKYFDKKTADRFDFKKYLGSFNIEDLLMAKLEQSEKVKALELIERAKNTNKGKISITDTWLREKEIRDTKIDKDLSEDRKKLRKRQITSSYLKKWNHVAAISICKEFNLRFPYSTERVIQHLSQGSIREVLRIMSNIWEVNDRKIEKFLKKTPIPYNIQTKGIQLAAENRFQLIGSKPRYKSNVSLQNVCERLGKLFSELQSYPYILNTPESASLSIKTQELNANVKDIIRIGAGSGWLMVRDEKDRTWIGLHPILAPKFQISFRYPFYYPEPISDVNLLNGFLLGTNNESAKCLKIILDNRRDRYRKIIKKSKIKARLLIEQLNLFTVEKDNKNELEGSNSI